jgi:transketolase
MADIDVLEAIAGELRRTIFKMVCESNGGHLGGSFSVVEILTALYFGGVMRYDPAEPGNPFRDRFILSKGHASAALYPVLARAGFFPGELLSTFCQTGSILGGHPNMHEVPGVEASTGALGHGFPFGVGIALAGKIDRQDYRVYVVVGDGECQEGSIWEAALFASHHKLDNLTVIVDYNKLQAMDRLERIVKLEPFAAKWEAFGWQAREIDGHNIEAILKALKQGEPEGECPQVIIAHTIKGKGVSYMENQFLWHYRLPNTEEKMVAAQELGLDCGECEAL